MAKDRERLMSLPDCDPSHLISYEQNRYLLCISNNHLFDPFCNSIWMACKIGDEEKNQKIRDVLYILEQYMYSCDLMSYAKSIPTKQV